MSHKKGFTLLELLIAAALMAVLAMFATQAFRASSSDIRLEDAKARGLLLFSAAQRYYIEYPHAALFNKKTNDDEGIPFARPTADNCNVDSENVQNLVDCGFLEYRQVTQESSTMKEEDRATVGYVDMWFDFKDSQGDENRKNMKVCLRGKANSRVLDRCTYCTETGERFERISCPGEE